MTSSTIVGARAGRILAVGGALALGVAAVLTAPQAGAVNTAHGDRVVSANPADNTPHVMNGSVNAIIQVGDRVIAAGTFTSVSPAGTFGNTSDDVTRNRMFAFNATTGVIDPSFNPNFGGSVNSLSTDGTSIYASGSFGSVGANTAFKRVAKLTAAGALVPGFKPVPNKVVNEVVYDAAFNRVYLGGAFTSIKVGATTTKRGALAALDPATGAVSPAVDVPFSGLYNGGSTTIKRFDVSPDGRSLVAIGNFTQVSGATRAQLAMIGVNASGVASVSSWSTNRYDRDHNACASVFDTFMRDVDFAPDGSYYVVSTTGAFAGGAGSGTMCDTSARWETAQTGNDPTWTDYTGGDTTYGVAVTGSAVYVGGHMRWLNNPFQGDQAGPGAVPRAGIAALDPINGLPLSWNPGRTRGVGAQALYATSQGLWIGSDTTKIAGETHGRIAFMPLAGGTSVPAVTNAALPNTLFLAQRSTGGSSNVLYRVNAGGSDLQSADGGPDWTNANGFVSGGNDAGWGTTVPRDGTVPNSTPPDVFASEHWGGMNWDFSVPNGRPVTVRLYFANQYGGTSQVGQRVFDVNIDGGPVELKDFDIVAAAGDKRGTMRAFNVTSDGNIDIDFSSVVENPLVNAIEIVDTAGAGGTGAAGALLKRTVDDNGSPTGSATTANTAFDWSTVRGAFHVDGFLYYGLADGSLYRRSFNPGTGTVGNPQTVDLYDDPDTGERIPFAIGNLTGMFYDAGTHRLYYTLFGDGRLYYRYFTPESRVVGAETFSLNVGVDLSRVAGMTLAGGRVLYGSRTDGYLRSAVFTGGTIAGPATVVSNDGTWNYRAIVAPLG